ncbi:serine hydrolase domain-containing protein [Streptomyces tendae]
MTRAVPIDVRLDPGGAVSRALVAAVAAGEPGLQVSAYVDGRCVVDAAAGWTGPARDAPLGTGHLFPVFSVTKGVVAAAVLRHAADGLVDLDRPLVAYWPRFGRGPAAAGKDSVTLRHVLTHSAGLPQMPKDTTAARMADWEWMADALCAEPLLWKPGEAAGYHAYTYGWLLGEPLRLALGLERPPGAAIRRTVTEHFGQSDFWLGLPEELGPRVVTLGWSGPPMSTEGLRGRALPGRLAPGQEVFGRPDVRRSVHPGAGGIATASAVAGVYDVLTGSVHDGGRYGMVLGDGVRLHRRDTDRVLGAEVSRGLGFRVGDPGNLQQAFPFDAPSQTFGHPGAGGSVGWGDLARRAGFAVNRVGLTARGYADPVVRDVVRALVRAVAGVVGF